MEKRRNEQVFRSLDPTKRTPPQLKLSGPQRKHIELLISTKMRHKTLLEL